METENNWKIRIAPSLGGGFAGTPQEAWAIPEYFPFQDKENPTVFMGVYGLNDFHALWRHRGRKCVLWCGSDIQHFLNGYWLDEEGKMRIHPIQLASWIDTYCENYVENEVEKQALMSVGIRARVVPSFLGDVNNYQICYEPYQYPALYTTVSGNDFKLYGWDKINILAHQNPNICFHLYGNDIPWPEENQDANPNVYVHGRVPQEQMDAETKKMQGALRLTEFDGFSEIVAKSLLWGQWPVSVIEYPFTLRLEQIEDIFKLNFANEKGREWLLSIVNKYPWNQK